MSVQYVPLHVHTEYSLLDGAIRIKELCEFAKENNMPAVAVTDHGVMYGALDLYIDAKETGIKPIIGCEFYVQNGDIESLVKSKSIWKCLSCFACLERCPRDVKPAKLIDAARQMVVREKGVTYLSPDEVPELLDEELPQQLLVSAFRRYRR